MEAIKHHGNNLQHNDNKVAIDHLVNEIINVPDGFTCFLCQVTNNTECIWNNIMEDIVSIGMQTKSNMDKDTTEEGHHRAARYACYQPALHFHHFQLDSWTRMRSYYIVHWMPDQTLLPWQWCICGLLPLWELIEGASRNNNINGKHWYCDIK